MPNITDADVERVKGLLKAKQIDKARALVKRFDGPRAAKLLAQINEHYPEEIKPSKPAKGISALAFPRYSRTALIAASGLAVLVIVLAAALIFLRPRATGATREMLELYRDICLPLLSWEYQTEGVDPAILSEACIQNAQALYDASPDAYTSCYNAMGSGDTAKMGWAMCYTSYKVPTPVVWPASNLLSTRIVPTALPSSTPIPPYASAHEGLMDWCIATHQMSMVTEEDRRTACDQMATDLYQRKQAAVDQCFTSTAGAQYEFKNCIYENKALEFDETFMDEFEPF